jgi:hypothetical protein
VVTEGRDVAERINEAQWQRQVLKLAGILGWTSYHPWTSINSAAGWPDIALCRPPRLILAELKSATGKVSPAQDRWLDMLRQCPGVETYLWRPADIDAVAEVLR